MEKIVTGKAHVFGDNIDTDQIYPGRFVEFTDPQEIKKYVMIGARANFLETFERGDIVVGGINFGCGSSREHAVITLKTAGVGAVIAKSFARIFYRNAFNLGLPLIYCPDIDKVAAEGEELTVDIEKGTVTNNVTGVQVKMDPISDYALELLEAGGIKNLIREQYKNK